MRIALALAALGALSAVPANAQQQQQAPGDAASGFRLFMTDGCYQCHGTVGQGGVGPRLAPDPIPAEAIAQYIRNPADVMPPYIEKVLGDAGVADIYAYLASVKPAPKLQDIPLLAR